MTGLWHPTDPRRHQRRPEFSVINPGKISDADTSQWRSKMGTARQAGATYCSAGMNWSMMQPSAGGTVTTGAAKVLSYLDTALAAGLKVVLDLSLHFAPAFVTSGVEQFKDQAGTLWSDTGASGNNVRNWQWTQRGRDYVADLVAKIGATTIPSHAALAGVRIGGGYAGESHYAPITTNPMQWWIYGTSLQTGAGLASDQVACPHPGRTPLWNGSNDAYDEDIANWWLNGMTVWITWLVGQLKAAGFGRAWVLHPSTGVRDRPHTDKAWVQEVARGVDPARLIAGYANDPVVWPWSTWDDDTGTAPTETGMGSGSYVLEQARKHGKLTWAVGENTHTNSDLAGCLRVLGGRSADSPNRAAGWMQSWFFYDALVAAAPGDVSLATLRDTIAANR